MANHGKTAAVLTYIAEHPNVHAGQIAKDLKLPKQSLFAMLSSLKKAGRITDEGEGAFDADSNRKVKGYTVVAAGQEGHGAPLAKKPHKTNGQPTGTVPEVDRWIRAMNLEQAHLVYTRLHHYFGGVAK